MENVDELKLIEKFKQSSTAKTVAIAYGGDGELLKVIAVEGDKKGIIPIRNYGRCPKHINILRDIVEPVDSNAESASLKHMFKCTKAPFINYKLNGKNNFFLSQLKGPVSEIVLKSANPTSAIRFDIFVNSKKYMDNCIADGLIYATSFGSHGYFKSVTRTIFNGNNVGLGLIAPTYGLCNLVLQPIDKVKVVMRRSCDAFLSGDKCFKEIELPNGSELELELSCEGAALYGYDIFCCPECRKLRNSTVVNDQWLG